MAVFSLLAPPTAKADPPPWAPAHGWRAKHDRHDDDHHHHRKHKKRDRHERETVYMVPYGIAERTCLRDVIGAAIGGAAGGFAGSHIGKGDGRTAAIVGGAAIGLLVGGSIGRAMDQVDNACVGQVLEHAPDRHAVAWQDYEVVPTRTWQQRGEYCREYHTRATVGGRPQVVYGTACRTPDGDWRIVN